MVDMNAGSPDFDVSVEDRDDVCVITVSGKLDETGIGHLERALMQIGDACGVVLDITGLEYLSSWGFGMLVERSETLAEQGKRMVFLQPGERLFKLFQILCMDQLLTFADDRDAAMELITDGEPADAP